MHDMHENVRQNNLQLFFFCRLFKEETSEFYSRACFVIFKLNLLPKLKKLKDLKMGQNEAKGPLLARLLGDPSNGLNDPPLEKLAGTLQLNTIQLSARCLTFADCRLQTADCRLQTNPKSQLLKANRFKRVLRLKYCLISALFKMDT